MAIRSIRPALALVLAAGIIASPLSARPAADGASTTVRFGDLDLASEAGSAALHARVIRAARFVCGDPDQRDLQALSSMRACRAVAMASAEPQIEVALAHARSGRAYATNDVKMTAPGL